MQHREGGRDGTCVSFNKQLITWALLVSMRGKEKEKEKEEIDWDWSPAIVWYTYASPMRFASCDHQMRKLAKTVRTRVMSGCGG